MMPEACDIGFKEWAGVCDALATGRQSIILRKGGIDEAAGPGSFVPEYSAFWLYPTHLHEAQQGLRETIRVAPSAESFPAGTVPISTFAVAQTVGRIKDERSIEALEEFHVWTEETVRKRFHYRSPGLWVLALRCYRRDTPWILDVTPDQVGCKSWVPLGRALPTSGLSPTIDDEVWITLKLGLRSLLDRS